MYDDFSLNTDTNQCHSFRLSHLVWSHHSEISHINEGVEDYHGNHGQHRRLGYYSESNI